MGNGCNDKSINTDINTIKGILKKVSLSLSCAGVAAGDKLLVALSGGADSIALLYILLCVHKGEICAAHLHHGIRESADGDTEFVKALATKLGIELIVGYEDVPVLHANSGKSLEEAARDARYNFLERALSETGSKYIALAHHMDDQAETVLMHLLRGSGLSGLSGMGSISGNRLRPLLGIEKSELMAYVNECHLAYCTDETNEDTAYTRNSIRLELLPYIKEKYNPNIVKSLSQMALLLSEDEEYLTHEAERALNLASLGHGRFSRSALLALPMPLRSRAIRIALSEAGVLYGMNFGGINSVLLLLESSTGAFRELGGGLCASVSYDEFIIDEQEQTQENFNLPFLYPGETKTPCGSFHAEYVGCLEKANGTNIAYMDCGKLPHDAVVRLREPGDRFRPFGSPGSKKLKQYLIDKKFPRAERMRPIIASGCEVLFFPGGTVSENLRVTEGTKQILRVEYIEN